MMIQKRIVFLMTVLSCVYLRGAEDDSVLSDFLRSYDIQEEFDEPLTRRRRLSFFKKGLLNSGICTLSLAASSYLLYVSYLKLSRQSEVDALHDLFDAKGDKKTGPEWDRQYYEAIKEQRTIYVAELLRTVPVWIMAYYNWKFKTLQNAYKYLKKALV